MLPHSLRFDFRSDPDFFANSRWQSLPGSKSERLLRALSFRVQKKDHPGLCWALVATKKIGNAVERAQNKRFVRQAIIELSHEDQTLFALPYNVVVFLRSPLSSTEDAKRVVRTFLENLRSEK